MTAFTKFGAEIWRDHITSGNPASGVHKPVKADMRAWMAAVETGLAVAGYAFDTATADADPGAGKLRLNHATPASATAAYVDDQTATGSIATDWLDSFDDFGSASMRGTIRISDQASPATNWRLYALTGSVVDGTGYRKLTLLHLDGAGSFTLGMALLVQFEPLGGDATFLQAGTGAVARPMLNKNRWRVDAEDYGAVGDGSTDDSAAIQLAIDHVNSVGGGEVRFESNEYRSGGAIDIKTGVRLIGKGFANTILKLNTNANVPVLRTLNFSTLTGGGTTGGPTDFGIIGMTLDGNRANQSGGAGPLNGLSIYGPRYLIEDVQILGCKGQGFYSEWASGAEGTGTSAAMEATIRRLRIDTCGRHGFQFTGPHDSYGEDIIIIDASQETDDTYDGFLLTGPGTGRWVNVHAWHRGATTNRMLSSARIESNGSEFIACHFEGGRQCLIQRGDRNDYQACHLYAVFSADPIAVIRGSHVNFQARIEDTTAEGAACLQIGESGVGGLFFSHIDAMCITAATNAVIVSQDDGRNTGVIKTVGSTNAYSGSFHATSGVMVQRPDGNFEQRGNVARRGTPTNDNAAAGDIGEIIESSVAAGSAVALTTATPANVTSISLTPGDWDVWGTAFFVPAGTTSVNRSVGAINTVSATLPSSPGSGAMATQAHPAQVPGTNYGFSVGQRRLSLSATTTVSLVAQSEFTVSTNAAYGYIGARRVR